MDIGGLRGGYDTSASTDSIKNPAGSMPRAVGKDHEAVADAPITLNRLHTMIRGSRVSSSGVACAGGGFPLPWASRCGEGAGRRGM